VSEYIEIRCPHCNRLLLQVAGLAMIRVKCPKCRMMVGWPVLVGEVVVSEYDTALAGGGRYEVKSGVEGAR
jgi:hypothetical protein